MGQTELSAAIRAELLEATILRAVDGTALTAYCDALAAAIFAAPPGGEAHASTHEPGGDDALTVDAAAATGSLRTLGAGAQQAAAGNHVHEATTESLYQHDLTDWALVAGKTLPSARRYAGFLTDGTTALLIGGQNTSYADTNTIFTASASDLTTWALDAATLPITLSAFEPVRIGAYYYTFGGLSGGTQTSKILRASVSAPTVWSYVGDLPIAIAYNQLVVESDYVYSIGGTTSGGYSNKILRAARSNLLSWSDVGTLPEARATFGLHRAGPWLAMVSGTTDSGGTISILLARRSDPLTWFRCSTNVAASFYGHVRAVVGEHVYFIGGQSNKLWNAPQDRPWDIAEVCGTYTYPAPITYYSGSLALQADGYAVYLGGDNSGVLNTIYKTTRRIPITVDVIASTTQARPAIYADGQRTVYSAHQRAGMPDWLVSA